MRRYRRTTLAQSTRLDVEAEQILAAIVRENLRAKAAWIQQPPEVLQLLLTAEELVDAWDFYIHGVELWEESRAAWHWT